MCKCKSCEKDVEEITDDGFCYACSNGAEEYPDLETMLTLLFGQAAIGKSNGTTRN